MQLYALLLCSVLILLPVFAEPALLQEKDDSNPHQIAKRSVFQLGGEIECLQHKHSFLRTWAFTKYNDYGCFCGIGGMGEPVDETDKCCRAHDNCYDNVNKELEKKQLENPAYKNVQIAKYNGYKYTCTQDGKVECYAQDLYFSLKVCKCDKVLSECLEKSDGTYNENYKHDKNC